MHAHRCLALTLVIGPVLWAHSAAGGSLSPFAREALPRHRLEVLRGGVRLPNGLDVALGFDLRTLVDGRLALHTVLSTQAPAPDRVRVLVGAQPDPMPEGMRVDRPASPTPELITDRRGAGSTLTVSVGNAGGDPTASIVAAPREAWPVYPGEIEIAPAEGGPAIDTALGAVSLTRQANGSVVTLTGDGLVVQHLIGEATGVLVANAVSNRRIDTVSTIDIDLEGAWVPVANGLFGVNAIMADAATLQR